VVAITATEGMNGKKGIYLLTIQYNSISLLSVTTKLSCFFHIIFWDQTRSTKC